MQETTARLIFRVMVLRLIAIAVLTAVTAVGPAYSGHKPNHGGGGGPDGATLGSLSPTCDPDDIARFDGTNWVCDVDTDTVGALTCTTGQVPVVDGSGAWVCTDLFAPKVVFVSSNTYTGALGGISGADEKCQMLADDAALDGWYKAWLSTRYPVPFLSTPLRTFIHSLGPYILVDETFVAQDFISLVSGAISNPIDLDESGASVFPPGDNLVWTGTRRDGSPQGSQLPTGSPPTQMSCLGWMDGTSAPVGSIGKTIHSNGEWTEQGVVTCNMEAHIYCFQQ